MLSSTGHSTVVYLIQCGQPFMSTRMVPRRGLDRFLFLLQVNPLLRSQRHSTMSLVQIQVSPSSHRPVIINSMKLWRPAGVYISATNEVYFTSNILNKTGANENYQYPIYANFNKVSLNSTNGTYEWQVVPQPSSQFVLPNGGTYYNGKVLMAIQGYQLNTPSSLIAFDPFTQRAETLLNNFYGRPFNSLNDVFKQYPRLPSQVYAFHPPTGTIRVVADGLQKPNGIQFSPDMQTCYISDTGLLSEDPADSAPRDGSGPVSYAYDVVHPEPGSDPTTDPPALINKRLFAFADNVVWNKKGALLGKILLGLDVPSEIPGVPAGRGCANMVFVPGGLLMFAEDRMYLARIKAKVDQVAASSPFIKRAPVGYRQYFIRNWIRGE
ncbi:SGL domain-containing protein [Rhizoctonia solani AG-1 IA]|uniref:SGL domain-containing protein n=1 Tax=Thanatephorus cucumeris (strain AG1-IA) TaxID=983506 RepID=L8X148_THACA|nr:SGL domain-containing protein [Rhizoctonia solani AG-1 IA]